MSNDLKIQSPEILLNNLKQISGLLEQYAQGEEKEKKTVMELDLYIHEARVRIVEKLNNLKNEIEQSSRSFSENQAELKMKYEKLEEKLNQLRYYKEVNKGMIQDMNAMCEKISKVNDECRTFNSKMLNLIEKIIGLK